MKKKRKSSRFQRYSKRFLITTLIIFVLGTVSLNSYESSKNIEIARLEKDISQLEANIDGLDMAEQELSHFSRLLTVTESKNMHYQSGKTTVAVVSKATKNR